MPKIIWKKSLANLSKFTAHCVHFTGKLYVNTVQFREKIHKEMRRVMITVLLDRTTILWEYYPHTT